MGHKFLGARFKTQNDGRPDGNTVHRSPPTLRSNSCPGTVFISCTALVQFAMGTTLANTLGAFLIGVIFLTLSYGVLVVQTYLYTQNCKSDSKGLKFSIALLWFLATIHEVLVCQGIWSEVVDQWGNTHALDVLPWSIIAIVPITSVMDIAIRSIFSFRIWKLSGKKWLLPIVIILLSVAELGVSLDFLIFDMLHLRTHDNPIRKSRPSLFVGMGLSVVADTIVAIAQTLLLWRSRSGILRPDSALRILMIYSVSTGCLSSVFQLAAFMTWITMTDNRVYLIFFCAFPSLLLNALVATLNGRQHIRAIFGTGAPDPTTYRSQQYEWAEIHCSPHLTVIMPNYTVDKALLKDLPPLPVKFNSQHG